MTINYVSLFSGIEAFSVAASRVEGVRWNPVFFSEIDPFPCAVLAHHFPTVPNLGDICKIKIDHANNTATNASTTVALPRTGIDILAGGSPCFVAGTMVLTPSGYVPIETIKVGDEVVGGNGVIRKVEAVGSRMAEVGNIKVLGRPPIACTPNHPFMCFDMKRDNSRKSSTYARKIPAGEDYVATRADEAVGKYAGRVMVEFQPEPEFPKCQGATFTDMMELAGWYLGDGYIRRFVGKGKKSVVFALVSRAKIDRFKARFSESVHICEGGDGKLVVNCTALADWLLANFGEHAAEKRIPYWCYTPLRARPLIEGYAATDGWTQGNEQKFCTVSPALAYGIADIIGDASVYRQKVPPTGLIQGRVVNQRDYYQVKHTPTGAIKTKLVHGRYASIVRSYGTTGTVQRVYNITVSDEHTYIANGLYTHNCQDVSVAGKRAGMSEGSGTRSSLAFEYARLVRELRPRVILWENVPGVLSANGGRDFAAFLCTLGELGYSLAWRVLDCQYTRVDSAPRAVPQRRRRVWLVGCLGGDGRGPAQILFERAGVLGDTPPRREAGQGFAAPAGYGPSRNDRVVAGARFGETGQGFWQSGIQTLRADHQGVNWPSNVAVTPCGTGAGGDSGGRGDDAGEGAGIGGSLEVAAPLCAADGKGKNGMDICGKVAIVPALSSASFDGSDVSATLHKPNGAPGYSDEEIFSQKGACLARVATYENHAQDSRVKEIDVSDTRSQKDGTGGNNLPLVCATFGKTGHAVNAQGEGEKYATVEVAQTLNTFQNQSEARAVDLVVSPSVCKTLSAEGFDGMPDIQKGNGMPVVAVRTAQTGANGCGISAEAAHTLDLASGQAVAIGFKPGQSGRDDTGSLGARMEESPTLPRDPGGMGAVATRHIVRRLTPTEAERLQLFPDGWTKIPWRIWQESHRKGMSYERLLNEHGMKLREPTTEECPDSPRYRSLGNSMATNCVEWILRRIIAAFRLDLIERN